MSVRCWGTLRLLRGCRETLRRRRMRWAIFHPLWYMVQIVSSPSTNTHSFSQGGGEEVPHPLDVNYELLKAELQHVDKGKEKFAMIEKYLKATEPQWRRLQILDVWEVNREGEVGRSMPVTSIGNKYLNCGLCSYFCSAPPPPPPPHLRVIGSVNTVPWRTASCSGMGRRWQWLQPSSSLVCGSCPTLEGGLGKESTLHPRTASQLDMVSRRCL